MQPLKLTNPGSIGYDGGGVISEKIPAYLQKIESIAFDKPITISLYLATAEDSAEFRKKLIDLYDIKTLETTFNVFDRGSAGGVNVTLEKKTTAGKNKHQITFRHIANPRDGIHKIAQEFTAEVTAADLAESMLPAFHLPERTELLEKLRSKHRLTPLGDLFEITPGINLIMAANRVQASSTIKGRLITVGHLTASRFLRNTFTAKLEDIPVTRGLRHVEPGDILLSTLSTNNPGQAYAMVVASGMLDTFPIHTILRLAVKDRVDPRLARVFFALWGWDKYRLLYPFIPTSISMIHVSRLAKLPIPFCDDEQVLDYISGKVNRLIKIDDERLSIERELEGVI